jgi:hypothetical protein
MGFILSHDVDPTEMHMEAMGTVGFKWHVCQGRENGCPSAIRISIVIILLNP